MNRLDSETRAQVINCLIEGCSIRSTVRMTGVAKKTVMRLLVEVGDVCADYQDKVFQNLNCRRLQLDEMWAWIYCKEKHRTETIAKEHPDAGDIWLTPAMAAGVTDRLWAVEDLVTLGESYENKHDSAHIAA